MVMCMLLCTVICWPKLKCPILCADFIVLAFCIFIPYCCDFCVLPFGVIKNNVPVGFHMGNGTRHVSIRDTLGSYLGPLVALLLVVLLATVVLILAHADDLVLLTPSWCRHQHLLDVLHLQPPSIDLICNVNKTVCIVFMPKNRQLTPHVCYCISAV